MFMMQELKSRALVPHEAQCELCSNVHVKTAWRFVALIALLTAPTLVAIHTPAPVFAAPLAACSERQMIRDHEGGPSGGSWVKVYRFGCEGPYAYAWALYAYHGKPLFDITSVLKWSTARSRWVDENRAVVCVPGILPDLIYRQGCFSN